MSGTHPEATASATVGAAPDPKYYIHFKDSDFRKPMDQTENAQKRFDKFKLITTTYRKNPDVTCVVFVPDDIASGQNTKANCPLHVRFHGGGFATGKADFAEWYCEWVKDLQYETKSITISVNYRLMPESRGKDILDDVDAFWRWFNRQDDGLTHLLQKHCPEMKSKLNRTRLLLSGESAGAFNACYSWLTQANVPIKAILLQYPMLRAYTRDPGEYRTKMISGDETKKRWEESVKERDALVAAGTPPGARWESSPPEGMDMAYIMSSTKVEGELDNKGNPISVWRQHFGEPDIIERLVRGDKPSSLPKIFILHGTLDINCPIQDSMEFQKLLHSIFAKENISIDLVPVEGAKHAFDYEWTGKNPELDELPEKIKRAWLEN